MDNNKNPKLSIWRVQCSVLTGRAPYEQILRCLLTTIKAKTRGTLHGGKLVFFSISLTYTFLFLHLPIFQTKAIWSGFGGCHSALGNVEVNPVNSFPFNHSEVTQKACEPSVELHKVHQGWLNDSQQQQLHYSAWKICSKGQVRNSSSERIVKNFLLV